MLQHPGWRILGKANGQAVCTRFRISCVIMDFEHVDVESTHAARSGFLDLRLEGNAVDRLEFA